jgi:hypothetical protein
MARLQENLVVRGLLNRPRGAQYIYVKRSKASVKNVAAAGALIFHDRAKQNRRGMVA